MLVSVLVGYLIKKHVMPRQGGARAKWQQRYFVLQDNQLSYYHTKDVYECCRSDSLPMDRICAITLGLLMRTQYR